jgi:hypothetical protein
MQQTVLVRGQDGTLIVDSAANPRGGAWLYWHEPGTLLDENGQPDQDWLYEVGGEGMEPDALIAVADSLQPYP